MILFRFICIFLCILSFGACKDEYVYPSVFTELTELQIDKEGKIETLITDQGNSFQVVKQPNDGEKFVPDTLYRSLAVFAPIEGEEDKLRVYSAHPIFSKIPVKRSKITEGIKTDPVDIQSIWRSGRYLNMILGVQVKTDTHIFHFIDDGITTNTDGTHTLNLTFYHNRKKDYEAFTSKICFSIPLWTYDGILQKGDKINLSLNTYKQGKVTKEFIF